MYGCDVVLVSEGNEANDRSIDLVLLLAVALSLTLDSRPSTRGIQSSITLLSINHLLIGTLEAFVSIGPCQSIHW